MGISIYLRGSNYICKATVCIAFLLGSASVNLNFASLFEWFRFEATEAQQPLLAEAPALAKNLDVLSDDSHESLGSQHYSPRTRAEILGRSPPVTPCESELESELVTPQL